MHKGPSLLDRLHLVDLPQVLLQVEVSAEALGAVLTREGLARVVRVHVKGQIVGMVERLMADLTLVTLLAAVRQLMVLVVAVLVEALAAILTHVRLIAYNINFPAQMAQYPF